MPKPCEGGDCVPGTSSLAYDSECQDVATWLTGTITHMAQTPEIVVAGQGLLSAGGDVQTWVGRVTESGALDWELILPELGPVVGLFSTAEGLSVMQAVGADAVLHRVSASGSLLKSTTLSTIDDEDYLVTAATGSREQVIVGGVDNEDFWLGQVTADGVIEQLLVEDYLGFADIVTNIIATDKHIIATVLAGTSPGNVGGDNLVRETTDAVVIFYDLSFNEITREIITHPGELIGTLPTTTTLLADGSVVVGGYSTLSSENDDWSAWAARVSASEGKLWESDWDGPEDPTTPHRLATIESVVELETGELMLGGRQSTSDAIQRWQLIVDADTGTVESEALGGPVKSFDSYVASAPLGGGSWVAGATMHDDDSVQWLCEFSAK